MELTVKNYLKCWLKIWPATVLLVGLGVGVGLWSMSRIQQSFVSEARILVVNTTEGVLPADHIGVVNNSGIVAEAKQQSGVDSSCSAVAATVTGNTVNIAAICASSAEDSQALARAVIEEFRNVSSKIYGEEEVKITVLTGASKGEEVVTAPDYAMKLVVPVFAGIVVSAAVAFVRLDSKVRHQSKK